jgi:hypothetical protein
MFGEIIKHIKDHLMISYEKDLIIDPNAADESFMEGLQSLTKIALFYNKSPGEHENVMPLDFLKIDFNRYDKTSLSGLWYDDVHIISQPPPTQAEEFIDAACKFAQSVSFIMPKKAQFAFPPHFQRRPSKAGPSAEAPSAAGPSAAGPSAAGPSAAGPSAAGPSEAASFQEEDSMRLKQTKTWKI